MEIRTGLFTFRSITGLEPPEQFRFFNFATPVSWAIAGITGTNFGYSNHDDANLESVAVRLETSVDDDTVTVAGSLSVGHFSSDYEGNLEFVLLVALELSSPPRPVTITGVEFNQAIQYFRSSTGQFARPDNSIPLIAEKNTMVRVYSDTSEDPNIVGVTALAGSLEILDTGTSTWTMAKLLNGPIAPIQDEAINRNGRDNTLNFRIPPEACTGQLNYRVRIFDAGHPNESEFSSGRLQGTLEFIQVPPLRLHAVLVNYLGSPPQQAPSVADLRDVLIYAEKILPVPWIEFTGVSVIDYAGDLSYEGSGWSGLVNRLSEMQGDSPDIYYALVPDDTVAYGKSRVGRAGASTQDPYAAAHEIGHTLGRLHAPCGGAPNVDPNYPFTFADLWEVGIDDAGEIYADGYFDIMGYCDERWITPYTYEGILSTVRAIQASGLTAGSAPNATDTLFAHLRVYRNRRVDFFPSFHYKAQRVLGAGRPSPYVLEFHDQEERVLRARRLTITDPYRDLDSEYIDFVEPVPWDEHTARIVVIHEAEGGSDVLTSISLSKSPPSIRLILPSDVESLSGEVEVRWQPSTANELHYLLRYSNDDGRRWRNIGPSDTTTRRVVDLNTLPGGPRCRFQLLATDGIRTAAAMSEPVAVPVRARTIAIKAPSGSTLHFGETLRLVAEAFSPNAGSATPAELTWSFDDSAFLSHGYELRLTDLAVGRHTITVRSPDGLGGEVVAKMDVLINPKAPQARASRGHSIDTL
jgi:hypothetical protein